MNIRTILNIDYPASGDHSYSKIATATVSAIGFAGITATLPQLMQSITLSATFSSALFAPFYYFAPKLRHYDKKIIEIYAEIKDRDKSIENRLETISTARQSLYNNMAAIENVLEKQSRSVINNPPTGENRVTESKIDSKQPTTLNLKVIKYAPFRKNLQLARLSFTISALFWTTVAICTSLQFPIIAAVYSIVMHLLLRDSEYTKNDIKELNSRYSQALEVKNMQDDTGLSLMEIEKHLDISNALTQSMLNEAVKVDQTLTQLKS